MWHLDEHSASTAFGADVIACAPRLRRRRWAPVRHAAAGDLSRHGRRSGVAALALIAATVVALAACATVDLGPSAASSAAPTAAAVTNTPDATPRSEPLHPTANATYAAQGRWFSPITDDAPFVQKGEALIYADRDQGKTTASGEMYDPLALTAAHARLPVPSYARVTNLRNGKSVIVRINDRGAFERESAIELSSAAAARLELRDRGGEVEVVHLTRDDMARMAPRATPAPTMAPPEAPIATASTPTPQPIAAPPVESAPPVPVAVPALPPSVVAPPTSQAETTALATLPATAAATALTTSAANAAAPTLPAPTAGQSAAAAALAARASSAATAGAAAAGPGLGRWSVQVGVFAIADNAEAVRKHIASLLAERAADLPLSDRTPQLERRGTMTAVLVGSLADRNGAETLADRLRSALRQDVVLVQH